MKNVEQPAKTIPVMAETDVLVVGSGPAGLSAALAAARMGAKTMLVERYGFFGGNITQAMQQSIAVYRSDQAVDAGGLQHEFERRAMEMGAAQDDPRCDSSVLLDADTFKVVADKMIEEAGVTPLLHCWAVDAIMEGDTINGIVTESKSGRQAILAKRVIDATGDGDILFHAGAAYENYKGHVTANFGCSGVDVETLMEYFRTHQPPEGGWKKFYMRVGEAIEKAKAAGEIPKDAIMSGALHTLTSAGEAKETNMSHIHDIDCTDVWDLTRAEMQGRQQIMWGLAALKKYMPGFENSKLRSIGSSIGIRLSRKIIGEYNITREDAVSEARFEDSIGIVPEYLDGRGGGIVPWTGRYFQAPYGIILPQKVENLLAAGRCVAGKRLSHAATRTVVCCCVTGQGAGVAAAVSVKDNVTCREVDIPKVQNALEKQDVRIR